MSSAVAIAERPKSCCSRWAPQAHGRAGVGALSDTGWAGSLSGTAAGASPPPTGWSRTPAVRTTSSCANGPSASPTSRTDATSRSEQLENGGVRHTAAFAHGLQSVANAVLPHVVDQRGHQPGAGAAERVAECDRAAVRVHRLHVGAGLDLQALTTVANASLTSIAPISSSRSPERASAFAVAGIGPVRMVTGSTPVSAKVWNRAIGVSPSSRAFSLVITSRAAAPSEICEEFPAVTTPSSVKARLSAPRVSIVLPRRTPSVSYTHL